MIKVISRILPPGLNHRTGRRADPAVIVIHVTEGSAASVIEWFSNPKANDGKPANVSSNFMIQKDGAIIQFVSEKDEAWAQGEVVNPTARIVKLRTENPNAYCLSIEHEGDGLHDLTDAQRTASAALIHDLAQRHGIPLDRDHVIGHHEIKASKTCPGKIDVDRLVREAAGITTPVSDPRVIAPDPPIVWSSYLQDWLIVTRVVSDHEWYFVPVKQVQAGVPPTQAQALLSTMPTRRA